MNNTRVRNCSLELSRTHYRIIAASLGALGCWHDSRPQAGHSVRRCARWRTSRCWSCGPAVAEKVRCIVQPCVALLNHFRSVGDGLLHELDDIGLGLEKGTRRIIAFRRSRVRDLIRKSSVSGRNPVRRRGEDSEQKVRSSFCTLKSYLPSRQSCAMAMSLFPMSFHQSNISSAGNVPDCIRFQPPTSQREICCEVVFHPLDNTP